MPQAKKKPQTWQLQDAKNRLSEVVRLAQGTPQTITLHGKPSAVVLSFDEYRALRQPRKSLVEVMRSAPKGFTDLFLERNRDSALREVEL